MQYKEEQSICQPGKSRLCRERIPAGQGRIPGGEEAENEILSPAFFIFSIQGCVV